jgi:hypothetical protein
MATKKAAMEAPAEAAPRVSRTIRQDANGHRHIIERSSGITAEGAVEWVREVEVEQQEE